MNIKPSNKIVSFFMGIVQHYNPKKYWRRRSVVVNPKSKVPKIIRVYYLFYIKRCDAFNNASMGTYLGKGAVFKGVPRLPHHLNGIIIGNNVTIGKGATIYQQVTIAHGKEERHTVIGDNCLIGKGATILSGCQIGDNVKIGANAVVVGDVPSNSTVVGVPGKILKRSE